MYQRIIDTGFSIKLIKFYHLGQFVNEDFNHLHMITTLTLMVSMTCVWLFSTSTALLWLMSSKLTPLAARIWSPIFIPFCSARPPGSSLKQQDMSEYNQLYKCSQDII